jgi:hypothetical protein
MKDLREALYVLGIEIHRDRKNEVLGLSQKAYLEKDLKKYNMHKNNATPAPIVDCYRWRGDDEVNDRPVGKPQEEGMMNIAASFSLSKKPRSPLTISC